MVFVLHLFNLEPQFLKTSNWPVKNISKYNHSNVCQMTANLNNQCYRTQYSPIVVRDSKMCVYLTKGFASSLH